MKTLEIDKIVNNLSDGADIAKYCCEQLKRRLDNEITQEELAYRMAKVTLRLVTTGEFWKQLTDIRRQDEGLDAAIDSLQRQLSFANGPDERKEIERKTNSARSMARNNKNWYKHREKELKDELDEAGNVVLAWESQAVTDSSYNASPVSQDRPSVDLPVEGIPFPEEDVYNG